MTIPNYPDGNSWTFISSGNIDLAKYKGKTVYFAFKYTSSTGGNGDKALDSQAVSLLISGVNEANKDGAKISIIAVKTEYNEDGSIKKVIVIMRDENGEPPQNEHRTISPKDGDK